MSKQKYNLQNYHLAVNRKINGWTVSIQPLFCWFER